MQSSLSVKYLSIKKTYYQSMIEKTDESYDLSSPTGGQGADDLSSPTGPKDSGLFRRGQRAGGQGAFDVIVIGAGAAGLMAAWELVQTGKKVAIIEARDRIGGRIHTVYDEKFSLPIEAGAEFVHGDLPITKLLLKKADIAFLKVEGSIWRKEKNGLQKTDFIEDYRDLNKKFKELNNDITVADFFRQFLNEPKYEKLIQSLKSYVEGYYAANISKASTFALRDELSNSSDEQYRVENGYQTLVDFLYSEFLKNSGTIYFSSPVATIDWQQDDVKVIASQQTLIAKKIIITVPIGVLQSEIIKFLPTIKSKINVIKQAGYGPVIKIILQFESSFWAMEALTGIDSKKLSFLFSEEAIPTWWTQYPKELPILTGWLGGPHAEQMKHLTHLSILEKAIDSLTAIFNIDATTFHEKLVNWKVINWATDPYSLGAYSYQVVGGDAVIQILKDSIESKLFFAGEGLHSGPEIGTVEAALASGRETAHLVIASF